MRRAIIGAAIGVAASALAALLAAAAPAIEDLTYDWRLASSPVRSDLALVTIDEASVRALAPIFGRWPWPRIVHSGVIDFLSRAHAKLIVYDVLFTERDTRGSFPLGGATMTGADSDAALVASVKRAGNVMLLGDATFDGDPTKALPAPPDVPGTRYAPGPGFEAKPWFTLPFPELAAAARGVGHDGLIKDPSSNVVRWMLPFVDAQGVAVPILGLGAVLDAESIDPRGVRRADDVLQLGDARMPLRDGQQALINFHGPASAYPTFSFFNLLKSEDQVESGRAPLIDLDTFRDKIVFVGTSAAGLFDLHVTPFGAGPGMAVHAAIADDALSRRFMRRASRTEDLTVVAAVGIVAGIIATVVPVAWASALVLALAAIVGVVLTHEVRAGLWVGAVGPAMAAALSLFGGVAWQYVVEGREKRKVKQLFGRYVSKDVFQALLADPSRARLGGERREMTVLFSDIRGFTTKSEASTPEAVVAQLNEYFSEMVAILFQNEGTLDKFVGDMVMGLFGAPVPDPAHADHAVATALAMVRALAALNVRWQAEGRPVLDIGIGINSGEMIAGNIGSDTIMSYTVIGDAVNLGSRLESLNKEYGTHILISQATLDRLTQPVGTRRIGDVRVKGKTQDVTVHEVLTDPRGGAAA